MLKGFKDFILRGNVIDLAVAVIIGAAFTAIVTSFADNLINPLIASIGGANADGSASTSEQVKRLPSSTSARSSPLP